MKSFMASLLLERMVKIKNNNHFNHAVNSKDLRIIIIKLVQISWLILTLWVNGKDPRIIMMFTYLFKLNFNLLPFMM